jgi:hypothetical protein
VCWEVESCVLGSRMVCAGKRICVLGSRMMCTRKEVLTYWEADLLVYPGKHIDVYREAYWCVLESRLAGVRWEAH